MNVRTKFEVRSFTDSWDNRGYSSYVDSPKMPSCSLFFQIFHGLLFGWTLWMYLPNLQSVALPVPDCSLGWGCEPPILGRGRPYGFGDGTVRNSSYRPFIVTFHLSLRVSRFRDIPAFVLQHATFPHPTSTLPKISPCSLGVSGWPVGWEERRCWANCPWN